MQRKVLCSLFAPSCCCNSYSFPTSGVLHACISGCPMLEVETQCYVKGERDQLCVVSNCSLLGGCQYVRLLQGTARVGCIMKILHASADASSGCCGRSRVEKVPLQSKDAGRKCIHSKTHKRALLWQRQRIVSLHNLMWRVSVLICILY